jgi:hypothetical protein
MAFTGIIRREFECHGHHRRFSPSYEIRDEWKQNHRRAVMEKQSSLALHLALMANGANA